GAQVDMHHASELGLRSEQAPGDEAQNLGKKMEPFWSFLDALAQDPFKRDEQGTAVAISQDILKAGSAQIAEVFYQLGTEADGCQDFGTAYHYLNIATQVRPETQKYTEAFGHITEKVQEQWRQADVYSHQGNYAEAIALRQKILPVWES